MSFLGVGRSSELAQAREAPRSMVAPMAALAGLCLVLGVLPTYVIPVLDEAVAPFTGAKAADALVPPFFAGSAEHAQLPAEFVSEFHDLGAQVGQEIMPGRGMVVLHRGAERNPVVFAMSMSYGFVVMILLLAVTFGIVRLLTRARTVTRRSRWDGGVRRLLPEMTYTATGFSNPVRVIFHAILRPTTVEDTRETVAEHFRTAIRKIHQQVHVVDRFVYAPTAASVKWTAGVAAKMHHGRVNAYVGYVLLTLVLFLLIGRIGEVLEFLES